MTTEEKKKQPKLSGISAGKVLNGHTVKKVYYYNEEKNYIIFKNSLDEVVHLGNIQVSEITPYLGECNFLRDMAHGKRIKKWVDYQTASALNEFFLGKNEKSIEILNKCMEVIKQKEISRKKWYILECI